MEIRKSEDKLPDSLMAGLLEHVACYLQTGQMRSAHQARLILECLATHPLASTDLRERGERLADVLEVSCSTAPVRVSAKGVVIPRTPGLSGSMRGLQGLESRPWLTWEWAGDAA